MFLFGYLYVFILAVDSLLVCIYFSCGLFIVIIRRVLVSPQPKRPRL